MKFGKVLSQALEDMPEDMRTLFLRFKELKKQLKQMKAPPAAGEGSTPDHPAEQSALASVAEGTEQAPKHSTTAVLTAEESRFIAILKEDLSNFNEFFCEKEEVAIIRLSALEDRLQSAQGEEELTALKMQLIDFHGELVLLLNWSHLNFAGIVKILKKHDKRTGCLLREPFLASVLQQPFYSTDGISRLVRQVEGMVQLVAQKQAAAAAQTHQAQGHLGSREAMLVRRTQNALGMWRELKEAAHTPSTIVEPPAKRLHVEEQVAAVC